MTSFVLFPGDCLATMRTLPDNSIDSIVTDPPYGISFAGRAWDYDVPAVDVWAECLRVLKPGGHLLAFAGTRTQHRMAGRIEDAGFEIRDMIAWAYGSGFPKSLDVSKAIDKARTEDLEPTRVVCRAIRAAMDRRGWKSRDLVPHFNGCHPRLIDHWAARDTDSQPSLPKWDQWEVLRNVLGMGHDLDGEVWRLNGRKGTPGAAWGDREVVGSRVMTDTLKARIAVPLAAQDGVAARREVAITEPATEAAKKWAGWGTALKPALEPITVARKPFTATVAENVTTHGTGALNIEASRVDGERWPANLIHDGEDHGLGEAARFFYCAKPGKSDRGEGNTHPTVKPSDLMAYLCRLVTPPGGIVLDPFMGSGSTGKGAVREGFVFFGCEREPEYLEIARARIAEEAARKGWGLA